jgi:hypothetical protein
MSASWCTLGDHRPRIQSAAVSASAQVVCGQLAGRHRAQAGQLAGGSGGKQKGAARCEDRQRGAGHASGQLASLSFWCTASRVGM